MSSSPASLASAAATRTATTADAAGDALFPIFLKLGGRRVVLVGGGAVATAKLGALLDAGADVRVVAPELAPELRARAAAAPRVTLVERAFQAVDLDGAWLVIAAATPEANRQVAAAADERRLFVVAVDDPPAASAYGGGTVRRGGATIAISTGGRAPALAGLLREALEAVVPDELPAWVEEARALRPAWRAAGVPMGERRPLLLQALNRLYADKPPGESGAGS
jgi:uroporphyrin-III C-methyltransferase/precorrin-2 dehydrogenase/sirohydrochlorin ferrochelatase